MQPRDLQPLKADHPCIAGAGESTAIEALIISFSRSDHCVNGTFVTSLHTFNIDTQNAIRYLGTNVPTIVSNIVKSLVVG